MIISLHLEAAGFTAGKGSIGSPMRSLPGSSKIKKVQEVSHEHVNPEI
jgi:hypothetical protein